MIVQRLLVDETSIAAKGRFAVWFFDVVRGMRVMAGWLFMSEDEAHLDESSIVLLYHTECVKSTRKNAVKSSWITFYYTWKAIVKPKESHTNLLSIRLLTTPDVTCQGENTRH